MIGDPSDLSSNRKIYVMKEKNVPRTLKRPPSTDQSSPRPSTKRPRSTEDQGDMENPPTPASSSSDTGGECCLCLLGHGEGADHEFEHDESDTTTIQYAQYPLEVLPPEVHSLYQKLSRVGSQHVELAHELSNVPLSRGCEYIPGHQDLLLSLDEQTQWCQALKALRTCVNKFYFNNAEPSPVPCCAAESDLLESARSKELRPLGVFFIEDTCSNIQVRKVRDWVLQWYRRACDIISIGNKEDVGPLLPIVQIYDGADFYLTFAVDKGDHIILLKDLLPIGNTRSATGLVRLRNAAHDLMDVLDATYKPWAETFVRSALEDLAISAAAVPRV